MTDVATVWVSAGGIRKEKSTNGIRKCTRWRYHSDVYQTWQPCTDRKPWEASSASEVIRAKRASGMVALAGWRHQASFPVIAGSQGLWQVWKFLLAQLELPDTGTRDTKYQPEQKQTNKKNNPKIISCDDTPTTSGAGGGVGSLYTIPHCWGKLGSHSPAKGGVCAIKSGVRKSESEAVHSNLCCQLALHTRGGAGGGAAVLCRRTFSLGQYCCRECSAVPEGRPRSCRKRSHCSEKMGEHGKLYSCKILYSKVRCKESAVSQC